jgi:hypothetical protein
MLAKKWSDRKVEKTKCNQQKFAQKTTQTGLAERKQGKF